MSLSVEELLAGGAIIHEVEVPVEILYPNGKAAEASAEKEHTVKLRPLVVKDIQLVVKAAKDNDLLTSSLMLQQALVEPKLTMEQISSMNSGLAKFLVDKVNEISGLSASKDNVAQIVQAPLARACFILSKEFGWTPEEVSGMTIGQVLLYLEMINEKAGQK
jgi:hypothetical protein